MSAIVGTRDKRLQASAERFSTTADGKAILMSGATPVFRVDSSGAGSPASIAITAKPVNVVGDIVFSVSTGTTLVIDGNVATVDFAGMKTDTVTVQARIREFGVDYIASYIISKVFDGVAGDTGLAGINTAQAFAYKRAAVAPVDSPGDVVYTFASAAITAPAGNDLANGWSKNIPAGTAPLYVRVAGASSRNATDNIAANEWAAAVLLARDGAAGADGAAGVAGADGMNTAQAFAYKRAAVAPVDSPGDVVYTFSTAAISTPAGNGLANGWSKTIPAGTAPLYVRVAAASSRSATDAIAANEWTAAVLLAQDGTAGQNGQNGLNVAPVRIYQRAVANVAPALPSAACTFTFATGVLTGLNNGWSTQVPTAGGAYLFTSGATAASTAATDDIPAVEWAAAARMAADGAAGVAGADGMNTAQAFAYKRAASAPVDSPGDVVYTFSSAAITMPVDNDLANGWTKTIPAGTAPLYVRVAAASSRSATDGIAANEWTAAVLLAQDGPPGLNGVNVAPVRIYQRAAVNVAPALPSATCTLTFATGVLTGLNNGWSTQVPTAGGAYLFTSGATAASTAATDDIPAGEWAAAARMAADGAAGADGTNGSNGANGVDGLNVAPVRIYQRGATNIAPALPSAACTFTFATGALTGLNNGWSTQVPTAGGAYLVTSGATAASRGATDDIPASEWSAAARLAADGATGQRGTVTVTAPGYSTWSDASAVYELGHAGYGAPINRDVVTLYDATHAVTKFYVDGAWLEAGMVLNGNLLVPGTVAAQALSVDKLASITADLGKVTSGDIYSATMHGGAGYPTNAYIWPSNGGTGFHLSSEGLLIGNPYVPGGYIQLSSTGFLNMPGLTVTPGTPTTSPIARFSGELVAAKGTIGLLRSRDTGGRVEIAGDTIEMFNDNGKRKMRIGRAL